MRERLLPLHPRRWFELSLACTVSLALVARPIAAPAQQQPQKSFVIVGADVADGSGGPLVRANVRVIGDRIARVGNFAPDPGEQVVDAKGLVLAPGFIDTHNHSDRGLETDPLAESQISQGLTTLLLGQDGGSPWPVA
jgi:N-acyl-D-amino-acid deacylase